MKLSDNIIDYAAMQITRDESGFVDNNEHDLFNVLEDAIDISRNKTADNEEFWATQPSLYVDVIMHNGDKLRMRLAPEDNCISRFGRLTYWYAFDNHEDVGMYQSEFDFADHVDAWRLDETIYGKLPIPEITTILDDLDAFDFDTTTNYMNANKLTFACWSEDDSDIDRLDLYKRVKDVMLAFFNMYADGNLSVEQIKGFAKRTKTNTYCHDDIWTIMIEFVCKHNTTDAIDNPIVGARSGIEITFNPKANNPLHIDIRTVIAGQMY